MRENLLSGFANNKGADQSAHSHSLISAFVIGLFESIIIIQTCYEPNFTILASLCTEQPGFDTT